MVMSFQSVSLHFRACCLDRGDEEVAKFMVEVQGET